MIACPVCGGETEVTETRTAGNASRRRRRCVVRACEGRVTTYEIPIADPQSVAAIGIGGGVVIVPRRWLEKLETRLARILGEVRDVQGPPRTPPHGPRRRGEPT